MKATNFSAPAAYLHQDVEDRSLVGRCLDGDVAAFEPLVERYQGPFFTVAARLLGDRDDARDAVQNTFLKIFQNLDRFDRSRRFFSWAYRILLNECHDMRRRRRTGDMQPVDVVAAEGPIEALETGERRHRVQTAILALSYEHRQVIVLRHFTGLSYDEVADVLRLPVKTVKSRLHTARQRLAAMLLDRETRK
jgi:RNA polymerase sigma-70 factor (ECF subfamily)